MMQLRATARERAGEVVDHADLDLALGERGSCKTEGRHCGQRQPEQATPRAHQHSYLPGRVVELFCATGFRSRKGDGSARPWLHPFTKLSMRGQGRRTVGTGAAS